ncbi:MAG: hypothetical protein ACPG6B_03080 [Oceanihabitans sp.]
MKSTTLFLFLFSWITVSSQEIIDATLQTEKELQVESLVAIDNFDTIYYINNSVFYKKVGETTSNYSNIQLGDISSANAFNTLKINLFYKNFNTAIILDNRLAEIFKIDFNSLQPYRSVSHITTGNDNTLWIFNPDSQQLALYDYKNNNTRANTLPIPSQILDLKSNYNFCWLLTTKYLYQFNYFGSLIQKIENNGYTKLIESNGNLIAQKENSLYFLQKGSTNFTKINIPELLIKQFLLTNETLYIYAANKLLKFQLKIQ